MSKSHKYLYEMVALTRRNRHGIMCVYRISLEVIRESSQEQLVDDTGFSVSVSHPVLNKQCIELPSLIDIEVVLNLTVPPVGKILRIIIKCVKTISAD